MSKSTLFLPELEDALQYWEDVNLEAEVFFQAMQSGKINREGDWLPLIGSEVDKNGFICRAIKNFRGLRSMLQNRTQADMLQYLPRVPKEVRDKYQILDFMRTYCFTSIPSLPYMLGNWIESKKVFVLDKSESVPGIDSSVTNYFPMLPHQSFVLKFERPMIRQVIFTDILGGSGHKGTVNYESNMILVCSDGGKIDTLFLPESLGEMVMKKEMRELFAEYLRTGNNKTFSKLRETSSLNESGLFFGFSIHIETGQPILKAYREGGEEKLLLCDIHNEYEEIFSVPESSEDEIRKSLEEVGGFTLNSEMVDFMNGFCKLISELPVQKRIVSEEEPKVSLAMTRDLPWNAVRIGQVRNLNEEQDHSSTITIRNGVGAEKSPHKRRGHLRRYRNEDGSIRHSVWVEEAIVRADKLEEENLQGSAMILKKKKENDM